MTTVEIKCEKCGEIFVETKPDYMTESEAALWEDKHKLCSICDANNLTEVPAKVNKNWDPTSWKPQNHDKKLLNGKPAATPPRGTVRFVDFDGDD